MKKMLLVLIATCSFVSSTVFAQAEDAVPQATSNEMSAAVENFQEVFIEPLMDESTLALRCPRGYHLERKMCWSRGRGYYSCGYICSRDRYYPGHPGGPRRPMPPHHGGGGRHR